MQLYKHLETVRKFEEWNREQQKEEKEKWTIGSKQQYASRES